MKGALKNTHDEERILFNEANFKSSEDKEDNLKAINFRKENDLESDHCFSETYSFVS